MPPPPPAPDTPVPAGLPVVLDPATASFDDGRTLLNQRTGRVLRISAAGPAAVVALASGTATARRDLVLGRRLLDAGLAHPAPAAGTALDVTVVVPVRDRSDELDRCLTHLGHAVPVVVVDDGSLDPAAVARVAASHGATCIARAECGGPGAARNTGLAHVATSWVAFVDSDTEPPPDWLFRLAGHLRDPLVAAVAPRIVGSASATDAAKGATGRYSAGRSALDLGDAPALVRPGTAVSYVPSAAVLIRRAALIELGGFDAGLRYGEDVDLMWRLHDAGWWIRYEPGVQIPHDEPASTGSLLHRRFRYGTSAGPLARRHPGRLAPTELSASTFAACVLLLAGRPVAAASIYVMTTARLMRLLRGRALPSSTSARLMARAFLHTGLGLGRATNALLPGLFLLAGLRRPRLLLLPLAPVLYDWWARRPPLDPVRWTAIALADDAAYGAGVWVGAVRARTFGPILPRWKRLIPRNGAP